ncbi:transcription initiation factor TFIID subunit 4b-like [Ananas comosus]|uniref:Transcription initiation factor TFIID subunit 4b-like n=1 Tax=Ananas comosus TaxID=4615 RepID=A0A6P5G8T7_ANACO|nr:transcription initiation factor TFIID subunit 4b-like [Ananas comosus]
MGCGVLVSREIIGTAASTSAAGADGSDASSQNILGPQRKKHRTSGDFLGQNIAAATTINLTEEEKLLLSRLQEGAQSSEATRNVVQEEEELFLNKGPLRQKLADIMSKYGLTNISSEAERCLSLGAEEYLRRLLNGAIEIAKQRVDLEKASHQIVTAPDIQNKIVSIDQKAQELLPQRNKNEEKVNNWRTAGNVAERAAVDGDYLASNWQLMSEQTQQKHEGLIKDFTSQAGQPNLEETFHITLDDLITALESEPDESKNLWIRGLCERRRQSSKKQ